jgi:hypothetical protein
MFRKERLVDSGKEWTLARRKGNEKEFCRRPQGSVLR